MTESNVLIHQTLPEAVELASRRVESVLARGSEADYWRVYGSAIDSYREALGRVIGSESLVTRMGKRALAIENRPLVVVDLMATTAGVRSLAQATSARVNGIAVSLTDDRTDRQKATDEKLGVRHLAGDLGNSATWRNLRNMLAGEKADYIISSGVGGLHYLPRHPQFYAGVLNRMWGMLHPDEGTMMLEVPADGELRSVGVPPIEQVGMDLQEQGICAFARHGPLSSALYIERGLSDPQVLFPK